MSNRHRSEEERSACERHGAVCAFFAHKRILGDFSERLADSKDRTLFAKLIHSSRPVKYDAHMRETIGAPSTVTTVVNSLNGILLHYSRTLGPLRRRHIILAIPTQRGGLQLGRYLACRQEDTGELVDPAEAAQVLSAAWREYRDAKASGHRRDISSLLREQLLQGATKHLSEKLQGCGLDDYRPRELEIGYVAGDGCEDQRQLQRNEKLADVSSVHSRTWRRFYGDVRDLEANCVLTSDVGTGKTTFLRDLQIRYIGYGRVAIYVHATELEHKKWKSRGDFIAIVAELIHGALQKSAVARYLLKDFGRSIVLLCDGLDQIEGEGTAHKDLIKRLIAVSQNNLVIASRPSAVTSLEGDSTIPFLCLLPFTMSAQRTYFKRWYHKAACLCGQRHEEIMGIPMLAYMVRMLVQAGKDATVYSRADLFKRFVDYMFYEYEHQGLNLGYHELAEVRRVLGKISFMALDCEDPLYQGIPLSSCVDWMQRDGVRIDTVLRCGFTNLVLDQRRGGDRIISFSHQSFQEYFAAEWANQNSDGRAHVLREYWNSKWAQVAVFLSGLERDGRLYSAVYCGSERDDIMHSRLLFATRCAGESKMNKKDEAIFIRELSSLARLSPYDIDAMAGLLSLRTEAAGKCAWNLFVAQESDRVQFKISRMGLFKRLYASQRVSDIVEDRYARQLGVSYALVYFIVYGWHGILSQCDAERIIQTQLDSEGPARKECWRIGTDLSVYVGETHECIIQDKLMSGDTIEQTKGLFDILYLGIRPKGALRRTVLSLCGADGDMVSHYAACVALQRIAALTGMELKRSLRAYVTSDPPWVIGGEVFSIARCVSYRLTREDVQYLVDEVACGHWAKRAKVLHLLRFIVGPLSEEQASCIYKQVCDENVRSYAIAAAAEHGYALKRNCRERILRDIGSEHNRTAIAAMLSVHVLKRSVTRRHINNIFNNISKASRQIEVGKEPEGGSWFSVRGAAIKALLMLWDRLDGTQRTRMLHSIGNLSGKDLFNMSGHIEHMRPHLKHEDAVAIRTMVRRSTITVDSLRMYLYLLPPEYIDAEVQEKVAQVLSHERDEVRRDAYASLKRCMDSCGPLCAL